MAHSSKAVEGQSFQLSSSNVDQPGADAEFGTQEKYEVDTLEDRSSGAGIAEDTSLIEKSKAYKMAKLKVDLLVTGIGMGFYLFSFLDKANLGNARVAGLAKDLKLTSRQYSLALTILYPPYMVAEFPAALLIKRVGANRMLPILGVSFGLVCLLQGKVNSFGGLLASRFFLGLTEGGLIPSIVVWTSSWYKSEQLQFRMACIFSFISLAGAFAGLLAAAILKLEGTHGIRGWRWIFYIEGAATIGFSLLAALVMQSSPRTAWWLKADERTALLAVLDAAGRTRETAGHFSWTEVKSIRHNVFAMAMLIPFLANGCILFGISYFLPTVVASFGYSAIGTQLHTVPPYAVVFACTMTAAYLCDRYKVRGVCFLIFSVMSIIGYSLALVAKKEQLKLRYAALFFQLFGGGGLSPSLSTWMLDNVSPSYKRAFAIALAFGFTQAGGILSTWIYPTTDGPLFHTGASVSLASAVTLFVVPGAMMLWLSKANKAKERQLQELGPNHVFPKGQIDDRDPRWKYVP